MRNPSMNEMMNYSGTHKITPKHLYEPKSVDELVEIVAMASRTKSKIRPVGRFLSPNGIASCKEGMLSLASCDQILNIDEKKKQITVESGAIVDTILEELLKYDLTLSNFSSIKEQQVGGWTQVAAHGTGARLPTVDEMIVSLNVITPSKGTLTLRKDAASQDEQDLFRLVRCGLGALGVVSEMTLQCIDSHNLEEITETRDIHQIRSHHIDLLRDYRHVRYMWIPYTNQVVVAKSNPTEKEHMENVSDNKEESLEPLRQLLRKTNSDDNNSKNIDNLSFSQLRDNLIDVAPLDTEHIKSLNQAEAQFWELSQGTRVGRSDEILGFDCGGQQWVLEMAFPTGTLESPTYSDLDFIMELKSQLEAANIPAPAPIEQRWSSSSSSYMSPAYSENSDEIFCWVGIIMYLPPGQGDRERDKITCNFEEYANIMHKLGKKYGAVPHWAKIELPDLVNGYICVSHNAAKLKELKLRLKNRYDISKFKAARASLDPDNVLSNTLLDIILD